MKDRNTSHNDWKWNEDAALKQSQTGTQAVVRQLRTLPSAINKCLSDQRSVKGPSSL